MKTNIDNILANLKEEEKQLLKDTINYGAWGDTEQDFIDENGNHIIAYCYGYCTNDAKKAGHFAGRKISAMFSSIYKKLCPARNNQDGRYISHCNDWWGDGSGDMLFILGSIRKDFEDWARN